MGNGSMEKISREGLARRFFLQKCGQGTVALSSLGMLSGGMLSGCADSIKINLRPEMQALDQTPGRMSNKKSYIDTYAYDKCLECGSCLKGCVYRDHTAESAVQAIQNLRKGKNIGKYLEGCVLCMKCNHRCPEEANPAALFLERLSQKRREEGEPASLTYMKNGLQRKGHIKNLFTDYQTSFTKKEKAILREWAEPKQCDDLLYCGCGPRLFPRQFGESNVLSDLPKFGGIPDCCGYLSFRSGQFEESRYIVNNLIDRFSESRFKRLVTSCTSCQRQLSILFPQYTGQEFPFEMISIYQWLDEQIQNGNLKVQRQLDLDCAFSECCSIYEMDDSCKKSVKQLMTAVGLFPVDLEHHGVNNACCGGGAYLNDGKITDVMTAKNIKKRDIKISGKKHVVTSCQGCYAAIRFLHPAKSHFLLDKILWALGDDEMDYYFGPRRMINPSMSLGLLKAGPSMLF